MSIIELRLIWSDSSGLFLKLRASEVIANRFRRHRMETSDAWGERGTMCGPRRERVRFVLFRQKKIVGRR